MQLRERAPHTVDVDKGHPQPGCSGDWQHRVDTACLNGHKSVNFLTKEGRNHVVELLILRSADGLFGQNRRRAHHGNGDDQCIIRNLFRVKQRDWAALLHGTDGHELADIWVSAAACAEQRRTGCDIFNFWDADFSHDNSPYLRRTGEWAVPIPR